MIKQFINKLMGKAPASQKPSLGKRQVVPAKVHGINVDWVDERALSVVRTLQDRGFDTVDANEQLGFDDDERVYLPAVRMLRHLGFTRVRLLTNNPAKVGALARHGIDVVERVAHTFPSNEHNWHYLQTKAKRSGHLF